MSEMTDMDGWMRDVADAAASLDKRGDRQMSARLMRLHRDMDIALLRGEAPKIDPSWSLHDRVEFALRDAGFDYDEASRVAITASAAPVVGKALRTDYVLEFITETSADVTHQKLISLGWTPPAAPARETDWNMREILSRAALAPVAGDAVSAVATGPYVERLCRIFRQKPDAGDYLAKVLLDFADASIAALRADGEGR